VLFARNEIDRSKLAATIYLDVKGDAITFVQARHASPLDRRDMDKRVRLAVIALDKAEALHGVEEFDRAAGLFTGQLALGRGTKTTAAATITTAVSATIGTVRTFTWRTTIRNGHRLAVDLEIGCGDFAAAIHKGVSQWLAICETGQTSLLNCGNVHEHIFSAAILNDKAEALLAVEKLHDARAFTDYLSGHCRRARGTSTEAAATASTAATETIAAATEPVTTAAETIAATAEAITATTTKTAVIAEAITLVSAASAALTATPFIKTHAQSNFPNSRPNSIKTPGAGRKAQGLRRKSKTRLRVAILHISAMSERICNSR
jgi:hypothetical protein